MGWTQERLAEESGVGLRTIQRLEAGHDASLETLFPVSAALRVPVRDLFTVINGQELDPRVEAMALRTELQQGARDRMIANGRLLFFIVGVREPRRFCLTSLTARRWQPCRSLAGHPSPRLDSDPSSDSRRPHATRRPSEWQKLLRHLELQCRSLQKRVGGIEPSSRF
ncbi:helix-turn-helix transcriptional regulator [uncultured Amnibacterium sp.]|uniref:helix-turn-helix transcriptional regulator n=1 Tax=uncultured Amnibacterium sp. TaxID=1631851 RepID=UPI0035CC8E49